VAALALTLVSFGNPRLLDESGVAVAFPEKGLLAIAYVAARGSRSIGRAELAAFLWGDDASNPLVNLRKLLSRIKVRQREAGAAILDISDHDVRMLPNSVDCDFLLLRDLAADRPIDIVKTSLACLAGGFFPAIAASSEKAELWLAAQQDDVISRFARALDLLSAQDDPSASADLRKQAAYRLLEFDPYSEIAYRTLIGALSAEGSVVQANAMFERYRTRLKRDLKTEPDPGMLAARDTIAHQAMQRLPAAPMTDVTSPPRSSGHSPVPRLLLMPPAEDMSRHTGMIATSLLEDVTISLCRARSVHLVAHHTARRIAAMNDAARQHAYRTCDIAYVLETQLVSTDGGEGLYTSLVDIAGDTTIWAERLPIDPANLGGTYSTMVRRVAAVALSKIERSEFDRIDRTTTPNAYQNFLIGKHHVRNMELPDIRRARKAFRETLKEMPDFAPALGGLSRTAHLEWLITARGDTELLKLAETHAKAAISADPDDSEGFHQLGVARLYQGAFDESIELLEIAERNAPSHADLIADHADTLVHASRLEDALAKIDLAFELNPFAPDYYWWSKAGANYCLGRYELAIENLKHVADQTNVLRFNAACWAMLGDQRKARAYMRRTMENFPDFEVDRWLSLIPIRDPAQQQHYRDGLHRAGFK
jgi:tetratricopeptide (TPR) repeat protein